MSDEDRTTDTLRSVASAEKTAPAPAPPRTLDFGFLPIPKHLRYDPARPAHFGLLLNVVFGLATTFSASRRPRRGAAAAHVLPQSSRTCTTASPS
jgi:hypothetical protein